MHYRLVFQKVGVQDINACCPFLPDEDDYELHIRAILEDIKSVTGVIDANLLADESVCVVTDGMTKEYLAKQLKPFLSEHFCYLRLPPDSIESLP